MNLTLVKNMCKLPDGAANSDVGDLKDRIEEYIDPALRYACLSWHVHLVDADTTPAHAPTITHTLRQFLEKKFLLRLELLSVLGAVRNAFEALQVIADWLEVCCFRARRLAPIYSYGTQESSMLDLVNDCFRFVTGYFEVISTSARHIYHSALAYSPKKSIVRELYKPHAHPLARIVHGLPVSWDANTAATTRPAGLAAAAWSPCDRFIAITWNGATTIDVLDSVALQRLQSLKIPQAHCVPSGCAALAFSLDGRTLTWFNQNYFPNLERFVVSWDLQTGGVTSGTRWQGPDYIVGTPSITCSANGKMVAVRCSYFAGHYAIVVFDIASGGRMHSHSPITSVAPTNDVWAHGESLRLTTVGAKTITIWELGLTSNAIATKIETLAAPEDVDFRDWDKYRMQAHVQFLPTPCRLALVLEGKVMIWDARKPKYLLYCTGTTFSPTITLSSDGRFFECSASKSGIYLWKGSPTGYILHGILAPQTIFSHPLLSRNGGSIVAFGGSKVQLWRTKGFTTPPSNELIQTPLRTKNFVLDFSPEGMLAAVAMPKDKMVTVLDLKSGVPQLIVNTDMEVYCLRVTGNAIAVIGDRKVTTWDLPTGECVPDATLKDSTRTINLRGSRIGNVTGASTSDSQMKVPMLREMQKRLWVTRGGSCQNDVVGGMVDEGGRKEIDGTNNTTHSV